MGRLYSRDRSIRRLAHPAVGMLVAERRSEGAVSLLDFFFFSFLHSFHSLDITWIPRNHCRRANTSPVQAMCPFCPFLPFIPLTLFLGASSQSTYVTRPQSQNERRANFMKKACDDRQHGRCTLMTRKTRQTDS